MGYGAGIEGGGHDIVADIVHTAANWFLEDFGIVQRIAR